MLGFQMVIVLDLEIKIVFFYIIFGILLSEWIFFFKEKTTKVIFTIVKVYMCWLLKSLIQLQWIYAFACCQYLSGYTENSF